MSSIAMVPEACRSGARRGVRPWRTAGPALAAVAVALTIGAIGALPTGMDRPPMVREAGAQTIAIRVRPADTLWSIARANPSPSATVAQTVAEIQRLNRLGSATLTPGSTLRVPASYATQAAVAEAGAPGTVR